MAQEPRVLLLDEPANHLDLVYQKQLFELIGQWLAEGERCVISVVHDLSLALRYGTRAVLLDHGCVTADGAAGDVLGLGCPAPRLRNGCSRLDGGSGGTVAESGRLRSAKHSGGVNEAN